MKKLLIIGLAFSLLITATTLAYGQTLNVASRVFSPPDEQKFIREQIIPLFEKENPGVKVDFEILSDSEQLDKLTAQKQAGNTTLDVILTYVSNFANLVKADVVADLTNDMDTVAPNRTLSAGFLKQGNFDGKQYFIPFAGDDYALIINRKALDYLPEGVSLNSITYDQLVAWAKNIYDKTGNKMFAVPGVRMGLLTYIVGSSVLAYGGGFPDVNSPEAQKAWEMWHSMYPYINDAWTTYKSVIDPMLREEVWLAITHIARAGQVYLADPSKFTLAPVPYGPVDRGSVAGNNSIAVVKDAPHPALARKFVEFMTRPEIQAKIAENLSFIPAVKEAVDRMPPGPSRDIIATGNAGMSGIVAFIPGPTAPGGDWGVVKQAYEDSFYYICARNKGVDVNFLNMQQSVIDAQYK
ncbi:MAG TPA: extracellular solute-binding protein [Candidatus Acetothermia bacterium]|nr:extracellular solute-binding protein [Candidatus Bipolaricaulota bacterium]HDJ30180.1 extracellular solute-binding protein [Candidatus Acetothermia bacterium]